ncbi:MAG: DNA repair protein RadA, partial [Elusimicrobia bacterium]|nr:DNA repair protein RadA [Elusimicrobiota bacterium]
MARLRAVYRCQECGHEEPKWAGQCPGCGAWNALAEEVVEARPAVASSAARAPRPLTDFSSPAVPLSKVEGADAKRSPTGLEEFDRLLGGGLVAGQVVLLAGPPGIGKSTLMLQVAHSLSRTGTVLYVTGEESPSQVAGRAKRLGAAADSILLMAETDLTKVIAAVAEHAPAFVVLDSVQTIYHPELSGGPGSVGQVRECAAELLRAVKKSGAALFLLGHVTKDGSVAGPKVLEHLVDTVLQFDSERSHALRVLRAEKNRFGPAQELGLFQMEEAGLAGVADAASFFLDERGAPAPGRAVSVALEGTRPILAEVQALVTPTRYPLPRRMATGLDLNRVLVLMAALEKHLHVRLETRDVYVSVAGGLRLRDPALDLAVCLAVVSSAREEALPPDWVFVGEVGLLGRLGRVAALPGRLKEAARAGFKTALLA